MKEKCQMEDESLQNVVVELTEKYQLEITSIEEWTTYKLKGIVFDTEYCDWNLFSSTFDKHVWNREKLMFLIETSENIRFGGFVHSKVDSYRRIVDEKLFGIVDGESFVFTFKDGVGKKYHLKEDQKIQSVFFLYPSDDDKLFLFGNGEISVGKKGNKFKFTFIVTWEEHITLIFFIYSCYI